MPYDALGNYIPGDDEPSLDQMRLALTRTPQQSQQQQRPLDSVTDTFKRLATEFNPLMIGRTLQDVPKIAYNAMVAPVASTWAGALKNVQAAGAAKAYGALGMPQEAAEAANRILPVTPQGLQAPLRSAAGQQAQEALGEAFNALRLPAMGPGSGMPGTAPLSPRPILTPNDVRVMGARAAHTVREAGQIPTDIANVRGAGIQRLSPLTGQPSVGSRIGAAIEGTSQAAGRVSDVARDVGQSTADYMQMRREMGLSPVPGVPPEFFPDLNMYAVRPAGTALTYPKVPPTKSVLDLSVGVAPHEAIAQAGNVNAPLSTSDMSNMLRDMNLDVPADGDAQFSIGRQRNLAFDNFITEKAMAQYPNAPTAVDALNAWEAQFSKRSDKDAAVVKLYDQFRESPEGQALQMGNLPSSTQMQERHTAASQWLNTTLLNYFKKHLGAEGDPLVQLASEGITFAPAQDVKRAGQQVLGSTFLESRRQAAGMPTESSLQAAIDAKESALGEVAATVNQLTEQRNQYRDLAMQQGLPDPAMLPEYAALTNPIRTATATKERLQQELDNLKLGKSYEALTDVAVRSSTTTAKLRRDIPYAEWQFYPGVMRAQPGETLYFADPTRFAKAGFAELASQFYNDVLRGAVPVESLKNLTVPKYVRGFAEKRIAEEKRQSQATAELKTNIESRMLQDMQQYVKPENYFGNVGVLELSSSTGFTPEQIRQLISDDTAVLDHCVADSGVTPGPKTKNLWTGTERRYLPLVDPLTGEPTPGSRQDSAYTRGASNADPTRAGMIVSVRDKNTGLPVATLEFNNSSSGKYNVGYASGYQNGDVNPQYHQAIKDYLNSRAEMIGGSGSNLDHVGIIDTHSSDAVDATRRELGVNSRDAAAMLNDAADAGQLPRFVSRDDLRNILKQPAVTVGAPINARVGEGRPAGQQPAAQQNVTVDDLYNVLTDIRQNVGVDESTAINDVFTQARRSFPGSPPYADLLREQPTAFAERIAELAGQQNSAIVEQALLDLADRIAPRVPPANQPPAVALGPFEEFAIARDLLEDARLNNQAFNVEDLHTTLFALENGNFDDARFRNLGPNSAAAQLEVAAALRQTMQDAGIPLPEAAQPAIPGFEYVRGLRNADRTELVQQVEPDRWDLLNERVDQAAAGVYPADAVAIAEAIRNGQMPDITNNLTAVEREIVARDVQQLIEVNARRQNAAAQQPGVDTQAYIAQVRNNYGDVVGDSVAREVRAAQTAAVTAEDVPIILRNAAERYLDPIVADAVRDLAEQFARQPLQQPANQFDRVSFDDAIDNLNTALTELAMDAGNHRGAIAEIDRMLDDLQHGADSIYGMWEGDEPLTDRGREYLTEQLRSLRQEYERADTPEDLGDWEPDPNHPANRPANRPVPQGRAPTAPFAPISHAVANMSYEQLQVALTPADIGSVDAVYDDLVRANPRADDLDRVAHLVFNYPMSYWENMSHTERALLYKELTIAADRLRDREGRQPPPEQGFQEGGSVKYPNFIDAQNVAIQRSQQMNPRVDETDTEADAARHMLASGYMAKSFNPTIAKGLGWLHEAKEAPFRTIGHALGLSNPRYDYEMDMHNNALGIELAKKAKDRADFERMVQESLKQSTTTTTPGRPRVMTQKQAIEGTAALKYANGGTVPQPRSLDAMKYELMMRSK